MSQREMNQILIDEINDYLRLCDADLAGYGLRRESLEYRLEVLLQEQGTHAGYLRGEIAALALVR